MPREEFTVRITPKGEIIIEVDGMPVRQVKDLMDYLEETLGPARQVEPDDPGDSGYVKLEETSGLEATEDQQQARDSRLRLGDEEG
jgi:S1-C subfamily serine protease